MATTTGANGGTQTRRQQGLDVWRTLAVVAVFLRHLGAAGPDDGSLAHALAAVGRAGWLGVDCFFVLSGFLVGRLLFSEQRRHGGIAVGTFLLRRAPKIYPAFYTFIAGTLVASTLAHRGVAGIDLRAVLSE